MPLSLFRGFDVCHLVLDGELGRDAGEPIPTQLTTACRCALAATVFDGISAYLFPHQIKLTQITMDYDSYLGLSLLETSELICISTIFSLKFVLSNGSELWKALLEKDL